MYEMTIAGNFSAAHAMVGTEDKNLHDVLHSLLR